MNTGYDEVSVRAALDHVVTELVPTIALEHDGYLMPRPVVQALIAWLSDLQDLHDERAIDVETWPTLAGFCEQVMLSRPPRDDTPVESPAPGGARCSRAYAHPTHDTDTGWCRGRERAGLHPVEVKQHAATARAALHRGLSHELVSDLLQMVGEPPATEAEWAAWSLEDVDLVVTWAGALHLAASDNVDVVVPPRPDVLTDRATAQPVCPECAQGKPQNCAGTALDQAADEFVRCAGGAR